MRGTFAFATLLATWGVASAAAVKGEGFISSQASSEEHAPGKDFIVLFNKSEPIQPGVREIFKRIALDPDSADIKHVFNNSQFGGFIASMNEHCTQALNAMVEIEMVDEVADIQSYASQSGRPWGLQRISNDAGATGNPRSQDFVYTFNDDDLLGAGVDIYIVDTGVRTSHAAFEGRATFPFTAINDTNGFDFSDGDGHGTHVAGTAGGAFFGVAQKANIIGIKILDDTGSGSTLAAARGMEAVIELHRIAKSRPGFVGSVMSMSWGLAGISESTDLIVQSAIEAGIHVSVAAGNDGADACLSTPSRNGGANSAVVSVGSVNIQNEVSSFSNLGSCVDIFAPGEQILSAWNISDSTINLISGTSMACPHVSGVMANLMAQNPEKFGQDPAALKAELLATARQGQIAGTDLLLLSNGANGNLQRRMMNWIMPGSNAEEKRTVTGSPANWAKHIGKRWSIHSFDSPLRY